MVLRRWLSSSSLMTLALISALLCVLAIVSLVRTTISYKLTKILETEPLMKQEKLDLFERSIKSEDQSELLDVLKNNRDHKPDFENSRKSGKPILLLTTPRSGSSWTGKFLSELDNSFYLFEPLHYYDDQDFVSGVDLLHQLYQCGMTTSFSNYIYKWPLLYRPPNCQNPLLCKSRIQVIQHCLMADYRIFKVIRLRLGLIEELLVQKSLADLKVILLMRDPRGTVNSYTQLRIKANWPMSNEDICAKLRDDVYSYMELSALYPRNFFFLRFEDISRYPFEKSMELYNFIHDSQFTDLPEAWERTLQRQLNMDDSKISLKRWENWRTKITEPIFNEAEIFCDDIFDLLGYRRFSSFYELLQNPEISSLAKDSCYSIPC